MKNSFYIEDIFLEFMTHVNNMSINMQYQDRSAAYSFFQYISDGDSLTENQGNYILKILHKYRNVIKPFMDYEDELVNPLWKTPFRVIDKSKKIWVEQDEDKTIWICLKFPFQLKDSFDDEFKNWQDYNTARSVWDKDRRVRKLFLYDFNLIQINEFIEKHDFEIDDSFVEALSAVEEIWQNSEMLQRRSVVTDTVILKNAPEDAVSYFESNKTDDISNDLFLAKSMGYLLDKNPQTAIEKIAATNANSFWVKTNKEFLDLCYSINGKVCIILDRTSDSLDWIKSLAVSIDDLNYDRRDFRVCFRTSNKNDAEFNNWVSENKFGGKIKDAKFLIFQHKPAKWLFKDKNDVIIYASNNLYPATNTTTRSLINNHPCVVYVGDIQPTKSKENTVVEL